MKTKQILEILLSIVVMASLLLSCGTRAKNETEFTNENAQTPHTIMIYAAASLTDVLAEVVDSFQANHKVEVKTNMASSGTLARQIEQGGEPDIFISASKRWSDYVDSLNYFLTSTVTEIAKNELVLIAPRNSTLEVLSIDSSLNFLALLGAERLSMGDPSHVPAGKYAKQSLEYYGWQAKLERKILPAKDVRSALMVVELGEAPLGIVYRTDAQKSGKVKILSTFPEASHKPIVYVGGLCKDNEWATLFFEYLHSAATIGIWEKYGFKQ